MSDTHVMETDTAAGGGSDVSPEDRQIIRQTFGFVRGIVANPDLVNDIPEGANLVLIPADDPELAAIEIEAGMLALSRGQDVYFRHIRPGDIVRGSEQSEEARAQWARYNPTPVAIWKPTLSTWFGFSDDTKEAVAMEQNDRSATGIINPEAAEQEARERFWRVAERIRERNQDKDPDEELEFITRVVEEVRQERYEREQQADTGDR